LMPALKRRLALSTVADRPRERRTLFSTTTIQSSGIFAVTASADDTATFAIGSVTKVTGLMTAMITDPLTHAATPSGNVEVVLVDVVDVVVVRETVDVVVVIVVDVVEVVDVDVVVLVILTGA